MNVKLIKGDLNTVFLERVRAILKKRKINIPIVVAFTPYSDKEIKGAVLKLADIDEGRRLVQDLFVGVYDREKYRLYFLGIRTIGNVEIDIKTANVFS